MLVSLNITQFHRLLACNLESFNLLVWNVVLGIFTLPLTATPTLLHPGSCPALWLIARQPLAHRGGNKIQRKGCEEGQAFMAFSPSECVTSGWLHLSPGSHLLPHSSVSAVSVPWEK